MNDLTLWNEYKRLLVENRQLRHAIQWALGEREEFTTEPPPLAGKYHRRYWWRTELRRRAFGTADTTSDERSRP